MESSCFAFLIKISKVFLFSSKDSLRFKEIALIEAQIYRLMDYLGEQRAATLDNVRRKQAKAGDDDEEGEGEGADLSDDDSETEDDGLIYNPKNLPLGWDGKVRKFTKKTIFLKKSFVFSADSVLVVQTTRFEYVFQLRNMRKSYLSRTESVSTAFCSKIFCREK